MQIKILGQRTTNGTFKNNVDTKVETQKLKYDISNIVDSLELMKHFKRVRKGVVQLIKEFTCSGDLGSIPGLGRSPEEGKGYPLQYSGLENSMVLKRVGHD